MKFRLLPMSLIGTIILVNCSGDNAVFDPTTSENRLPTSQRMTEAPQPQYPPEYGLNEFTPPALLTIRIIVWNPSNGHRMVTVGASLMDFYGRPYTNPGIAINFEIIPDSIGVISSPAYTDQNGCARSKLEFPPVYALEEITLIASCNWAADTLTIELPLIDPQLELNAEPQMLRVNQPGEYDTSYIACRLSDGTDNFVNGGYIKFIALVAGEICGPTWVFTDDHGWAYTQYRIRYEDIPESNSDPGYIQTAVRAILFGYPDVDEEILLNCYRE
jgi:hypothetical protein